jgi:hypothetical protein
MKHGIPVLFILVFIFGAAGMAAATDEASVGVENNHYYLESLRLTDLARESFEYGDYDASTNYAAEAAKYARLSDEYVALRLKMREADEALNAAANRLIWAGRVGASARYPTEYEIAQAAYKDATEAQAAVDWDKVIEAALTVVNALAYVQPDGEGDTGGRITLPAQYTVRSWALSKDCFWNIAARLWAYGDSDQWRVLYNANRAKLPSPNNPNLLLPGTVLDIPSIRGEVRQGMWNEGRAYRPLP